jgi:lysophospholipase L1-like esterase
LQTRASGHCWRLVLLLLFGLAVAAAATSDEAPLRANVGGRVVAEASGAMSFGWPGVYFEGRFRGTGVRVRFEAPAEHMRLLIDGEERTRFSRPGRVDLVLDALPAGEHVVRLEKLTESQTGGGRFLGFFATEGGESLPPPRRPRQIEFIGDSFSVGYGNLSTRRECTPSEVHDLTDTQQAFPALVARHFDADYRVNAFSGFGIVRNYGGRERGLSLPVIYPRLRPDDAEHLEGPDPGWRPQLIVVNLGTNDFSTPLQPGEPWLDQQALRADYRRAYAAFVRRLAGRHPQARFLLMGADPFFGEVEQVAATLRRTLPGRVATLSFGGMELTGCDWHPSLADHRRLADRIVAALGAF